ncbi:MAG: LLM class F420-dependent oxidoreductase [Microthrixaceae bacterium]|nr:LLM class F420-dependent oxidoreductase [Microthrixaceae bacterium]MCO5311784.1 LLM class F420-dependent oxidoreductase [Microthrixaceae bacterium]HPB45683.1 LLM class F420-dependent oxidoreductase [Microthrixaceae bacterium]
MKLGLTWGYWGALPPGNLVELTQEAERLGFDSVWSAEAWGSDAFSPLAYLAAHTSTIKLGTGVVQLSGRTPTAAAMHAITLDHLSQGRLILGLGVSGPQVVEGWYGQAYRKPLTRTREYVEIIRRVLAREEPLEFQGEFHQHPFRGEGSTGLGKPLKAITHPYRRDIPIFLGAEGPKNVAMTAEIADGWLPLYYSPFRPEVYAEHLDGAKDGFEVTAMANITITDDLEAGLYPVKAALGFYIGGMGAKGKNFHTDLMARMGYEEEAYRIQDLFFEGRRDEAIAMVPDQFADEISLVGPPGRIKERLQEWKNSPVTTVTMYPSSPDQLRQAAEIILGD